MTALAGVATSELLDELVRRGAIPAGLDGPGMVGNRHPGTAHRAARTPAAAPRFGTQRWQVLRELSFGAKTCAQLATLVGKSRNQTAARVLELRESGLIRPLLDDDGQVVTRTTTHQTGDRGTVYGCTSEGFAYVTKTLLEQPPQVADLHDR